jgi:hypothetical protein
MTSREEAQLFMFSRPGKSTYNLYLAFQDKNKHKDVVSKVMDSLGLVND